LIFSHEEIDFLLSLEDERNEDLTFLREVIGEGLLVPLVVGVSARTEVGNSPDEEGHGSWSEATGNIVAEPLEALTAVVGRQQEAVHADRRRNLVLAGILRVLAKRTKNLVTVHIADEAEDPHAEANGEADSVECGGSDGFTSELGREEAVEPAVDAVVHHGHEGNLERHGLDLAPAESGVNDATVSVVGEPHVEQRSVQQIAAVTEEEENIEAGAHDLHQEPANCTRKSAVKQGPASVKTRVVCSEEELCKGDDGSHQSPRITSKSGIGLNLLPKLGKCGRKVRRHPRKQANKPVSNEDS